MRNTKILYKFSSILGAVILLAGLVTAARAGSEILRSAGQTIYVPIYSHIYSGLKGRPFNLAATLSIRNTDPKHSITLVAVTYYDSEGRLVREYINEPLEMKALVSNRFIILEGDKTGGSGSNFIVKWRAAQKVNSPIIEGVMIGTHSGQGISFVSRGQIIKNE